MLLLQPAKVFLSSAALQVVHLTTHQQSPNTMMDAGKMLEPWLKLDVIMVQSPQDLSLWFLVVIQILDNVVNIKRKFISERNESIILIFQVRIRSCGISVLLKAKSSIQHYRPITHLASPCSLLMRITAARIKEVKSSTKNDIGKLHH